MLGTPHGWYVIGRAKELPAGAVRPVELAGERQVLWRAATGDPVLQEAYCPHLGADLTEGGCVTERGLRCPFHGFVFADDGSCVATGYDTKPPPTATLRTRPVIERFGLLFAWVGGDTPSFELGPDEVPGERSRFHTRSFELPSHPQEISENSVDVGHFAWIHGYQRFRVLEPAEVDGHQLRALYTFRRPVVPGIAVDTDIRIRVCGLGYSHVHVRDAVTGLQLRLLVLPTPIRPGWVRLTIAAAVLRPESRVPWRLVKRVLPRLALEWYAHDVRQDFRVWTNKRWVERPALAAGDGPIGRYRRWAKQFYPEPA